MSFSLRCLFGVAWGLLLWGTLQVSSLKLPGAHSVCGPWGCGPQTSALIGCHGAWFVILSPLAWIAAQRLSARQLKWLSIGLTVVGALGLTSVVMYERWTWFEAASDRFRIYFWQRCAFSIVTMTDIPLLQVFILGLWIGLDLTMRRSRLDLRRHSLEI